MKILMVCTGNICRSPMAEGIMRRILEMHGLEDWQVDSAGTCDYHKGAAPDARAIRVMKTRGIDISTLRARRIEGDDFTSFDLILVATDAHLRGLDALHRRFSGRAGMEKMLATHPTRTDQDLHDPYYGTEDDFAMTYEELHTALHARLERR